MKVRLVHIALALMVLALPAPLGSGDPGAAAAAVVLPIAVAGACYLLAVSTLTAASGVRPGRRRRAAGGETAPLRRRLAHRLGGSGLVASIALPSAVAVAGPAVAQQSPPGTAVLEELPAHGSEPPAPEPPPVAVPAPVPATPPPLEQWTVAPGESLWSIAAEHLTDAWGRPPSDAEVIPYWRAVIDANADRLAVPGNADLIYPGQVLMLPALT